MVKQTLVSILINNYNYAHLLPKAIDSALNQTYPWVETIVVDDGSTDNSPEIIGNYGKRIIPLFKENGDHASTFNAGFLASQGEIICCLDADDYFQPNKVTEIVEIFKAHSEIGWCFHPLRLVNIQTEELLGVTRAFPLLAEDISTLCDFQTQLGKGKLNFYPPSTSALSFRRSLLQQILPLPEILKQAADRYLTYAAIWLSVGYFLNRQLTIQGIHGSNDGTLRQGKKFKQRKARNQLVAAYLLRTKFPKLVKLTNRLFARGFSYYWLEGIQEAEGRDAIAKYYKTATRADKFAIAAIALYHSRPWKKIRLYTKNNPENN
ncbi:MAG: glycosyltransferase family 2 protein [Pleurocapsa sp. MO_226.B13]|nr:glycosyltransferase family 2 protein [Pleurocapsa sp. MO_226.B13]